MQTSSLITLIKKQFPDWSRMLILEYLNEIQKIIFTQNTTRQMRVIDSATGKDPVITVAGTAEVEVNDVWRVSEVYSQDIKDPMDVVCFDATSGSPARVIFNCGPVSGSFHIRAYRFPNELETEEDQLEIPEAYHISHIMNGVCGMIEQFRSGKSERWEFFLLKQVNDIVKRMSDGKSSRSYFVTPKGY